MMVSHSRAPISSDTENKPAQADGQINDERGQLVGQIHEPNLLQRQ